MKKIVLSTKELCKTYISDGEGFHAIKNVNVDIYEEDFTVIMGSSGSGKSTLLYLLSGLDNLTTGKVLFEDILLSSLSEKKMATFRRKNIGFVFQAINLVSSLTIFENIVLTGYLSEKNKKEVDSKAYGLLCRFGLEEEVDRLPSRISGGQQQRAAIARALINNPKILFADEPTGALNSQHGQNVLDIMSELNNNGQTIVMVTHDIKAASRANRILFIKDGRIDGDLSLSKYSAEGKEQREKAIFEFLTEKGW